MTRAGQALGSRLLALQPAEVTVQLKETLHADFSVVLPQWLAAQSLYPKLLWSSRDGSSHTAAIGEALRVDSCPRNEQLQQDPHQRLYCIHSFDDNQPQWHDFEQQLYYLPDIEIRLDAGCWSLHVTTCKHSDITKLYRQLTSIARFDPLFASDQPNPALLDRTDYPSLNEWQHSVAQAQQQITNRSLQKVVLARETRLQLSEPLSFWDAFLRWDQQAINSYRFAYQKSSGKGFISFSPERLLLREENNLFSEALAGTCARSVNAATARTEARRLLNDPKNRMEHRLVIDDITQKLQLLGVQVNDRCETSLLQQPNIQHLHHLIHGLGTPLPDDLTLLQQLHPTAAIGGLPVKIAQDFIRQNEPIKRGWYAGYYGYLGLEKSELAVAIRCAHIDHNFISLYAGAGIIEQSDALLEWNELEQKITVPLSLFLTNLDNVRQHSSIS